MWAKAKQYLQKMGGVILFASIIIWALSYFPQYEVEDIPEQYQKRLLRNAASTVSSRSSEEIDTSYCKRISARTLNTWPYRENLLSQ